MIGLETIQKAIDYMEAHLEDGIRYEDVAAYVNMSPYEFHRTFSFIAGITVNSYIRNRRLSLAGQELLNSDVKVIDLAMKYGFDSADGFAKAFSRFHGVSPKYARGNGAQLALYNPLSIQVSLVGGKKIDYRIEKVPSRKFLAVAKTFPVEIINEEGNEDIAVFWEESRRSKLIEKLQLMRNAEDSRLFGLCEPLAEHQTFFDYGIGIFLEENVREEELFAKMDESLKEHIRLWTVEESTYVVFPCIGSDGDCISKTWEFFYKEFLPQSSYVSSEKTDFEIYFENGSKNLFCELWIPVD